MRNDDAFAFELMIKVKEENIQHTTNTHVKRISIHFNYTTCKTEIVEQESPFVPDTDNNA